MSTQMTGLSFERVQIDGFRGLRGLDLDGLGRVNILIGANDSGKTSVLEALSVLCKPYDPFEWLRMVSRRDFGGADETVIQSLRWGFTQTRGLPEPDALFSGRCEFTCQGRFPLRKLGVAYREGIGQRPEAARQDDGRSIGANGARAPMLAADLRHQIAWDEHADGGALHGKRPPDGEPITLRVWESGPQPSKFFQIDVWASLPCETLTPYSYQTNALQVISLSQQILRDDAIQSLRLVQSFDPDVMGIQVLSLRGNRPSIYVQHHRLGWAPLSIFGDAMRRCVLLAATLPRLKDGGVLLIDEVETGIHVKALGRVFEWLIESARKFNVQVFVTTHSLEVLDAIILAPSAQAGDVVAFRLSRTDGASKVKRFAGDLLLGLRQERGLDLR